MGQKESDNVLVSTAILVAHHLGMKAGAVGVETPWQNNVLAGKACDAMQGHLTTLPLDAEDLVGWVKAHAA